MEKFGWCGSEWLILLNRGILSGRRSWRASHWWFSLWISALFLISSTVLTHCLRTALMVPFRLKLLHYCGPWAWSNNPWNQRFFPSLSVKGQKVKTTEKKGFYVLLWKITKHQKPVLWKPPIFVVCMISLIHMVWFCQLCQITFISYMVSSVRNNMILCGSVQLWIRSCLPY